jgi:HSP20 family protein
MSRDLVELMHALFVPALQACGKTQWSPAMDVYRTPGGWLLKLELAGVEPGDLSITVRGPRLTVQGRRRDCFVACGFRQQRMEIAYGEFERIVELPCALNPGTVATEYREGMLLIEVRNEEATP